MIFPIGSLIKLAGNRITDHNRQPMSMSLNRIESSTRMANGSLRRYWIADKRSFDIQWKETPSIATTAVDGFWSANEIEAFYNSTVGSFILTVTDGKNVASTFTVVFADFQKTINKRGPNGDRLDFSIKLEEV